MDVVTVANNDVEGNAAEVGDVLVGRQDEVCQVDLIENLEDEEVVVNELEYGKLCRQ